MKFLPKPVHLLFLPKFTEASEQEDELSSGEGVPEKEKFGDSIQPGEISEGSGAFGNNSSAEGQKENQIEKDEEGKIFLEHDEGEKINLEEDKDSKNIFLSKEDQRKLDEIMKAAIGIEIFAPLQEQRGNITHLHFPTQVDLRRAMSSEKNLKYYNKLRTHISNYDEWYGAGCRHPKQVIDLCENGWDEGVEKIEELAKLINLEYMRGKKPTRKRTRGRQGSVYRIHAARAGKFDRAWTRSIRVQEHKRISKVEVWLQVVGHCHERASDMFWAPATAVALAEVLQRKRFAVQIMSCSLQRSAFIDNFNDYLMTTTCLKSFSNTANVEELAISALAGNFRYYWFLAFCSVDRKLSRGLGRPQDIQEEMLPKIPAKCKRIIVPRLRSFDSAKAWLTDELKKIAEEM